jgi:hypothetical protein
MCLRKSPELTPELVEAARRNAQHATGPRSEAGKEKVKMNAVKHGFYSAAENHQLTMLALGEDPKEFEALVEQMMTTYGPGDDLWSKQIEDLSKLYWRRSRLERMQAGVMRRALLGVEEWQHRRALDMANATFDASHPEMLSSNLPESTDLGVRLRRTLSTLGVIRALVAQTSAAEVCGSSSGSETSLPWEDRLARDIDLPVDIRQWTLEDWGASLPHQLETLSRGRMGWRMARICRLLRMFSEVSRERDPKPGATPEAIEADLQELLGLLDEEIAALQPEFEYAEKLNAEKASIERDACLAPEGETWRMMLRQESALDRSIDRKVKMILGMRKNHIDDSLNVLMAEAGLKGSKESETDPEMEEINRMVGMDIPSEEAATDTPAEERAPVEPPEDQNSRNKPGMSKKTKGNTPKAGSDKMYQTATNLDRDAGNASQNVAA